MDNCIPSFESSKVAQSTPKSPRTHYGWRRSNLCGDLWDGVLRFPILICFYKAQISLLWMDVIILLLSNVSIIASHKRDTKKKSPYMFGIVRGGTIVLYPSKKSEVWMQTNGQLTWL